MVLVVYVGNAATLSFLQLLRGTVSQSIGRSQFSHNAKNDVMLETDDSELTIPPYPEEELDFEQRLALIRKYMIVVSLHSRIAAGLTSRTSSPFYNDVVPDHREHSRGVIFRSRDDAGRPSDG
jgi:hypothetical protein